MLAINLNQNFTKSETKHTLGRDKGLRKQGKSLAIRFSFISMLLHVIVILNCVVLFVYFGSYTRVVAWIQPPLKSVVVSSCLIVYLCLWFGNIQQLEVSKSHTTIIYLCSCKTTTTECVENSYDVITAM